MPPVIRDFLQSSKSLGSAGRRNRRLERIMALPRDRRLRNLFHVPREVKIRKKYCARTGENSSWRLKNTKNGAIKKKLTAAHVFLLFLRRGQSCWFSRRRGKKVMKAPLHLSPCRDKIRRNAATDSNGPVF